MTENAREQREIRVFLSSTFKDMEAERNHLLKHVFPKVRAACLARHVGFTEIDLRWGITEEESKNGVTIEICLAEIERCRAFPPFFIGFLGERYGWMPRFEDLATYWEVRAAAGKSGTESHLELAPLTARLNLASGDPGYEQRIRAAIEQGLSVTELEIELAVLAIGADERLQAHALYLLRDRSLTDSLYKEKSATAPDLSDTDYYDPAGDKLAKLKDRLRASPLMGIDGYTSIEQFGEAVEKHLFDQIQLHFPQETIPDNHALSNVAHATFRLQRLQNFLPRTGVRDAIFARIGPSGNATNFVPVLYTGPSGQGKSAIMADLARRLERLPGYRVIDHYIGADGDISLDGWVIRLLRILHPLIADQIRSIPNSRQERASVLPAWLRLAADRQQCRYVLLLDGLDQLVDGGKNLDVFRNNQFSASAAVIASAADDTLAVQSAVALGFDLQALPPLDHEMRKSFIKETFLRYSKLLPTALIGELAGAPQTGNPLYLMLALERLRLNAHHENLAASIGDILAQPDAENLFLQRFLLDADNARPQQPDLALAFMALLAASRIGLTEYELGALLAMPTDPISEETNAPRLPQIFLSHLVAVFQPFLLRKNGNWAPMHSLLGRTALDAYGAEKARIKIARYFEMEWRSGRNVDRAAIELTGQLWVLGNDDKLQEAITDPKIALRVCERNPYEFSRYWVEVIKNQGNSGTQAEILVRRLADYQEQARSNWAKRTGESLRLGHAFVDADEIEWSSRLYHGVVMKFELAGGRIPEKNLKAALRGFVRCFLKMALGGPKSINGNKTLAALSESGHIAIGFMERLIKLTPEDPFIDRAEDALLLSDLYEKTSYMTGGSNEAEKLRAKAIADALLILENEKCVQGQLFYATKAKAYAMALKAQLDSISRSWDAPATRNRMINQAMEISENFRAYSEQHLVTGHPQRVLILECIHVLYSQAAYATPDLKECKNFWIDAAAYAWETINELEQSYFSGEQHDLRMLNAAETISLALEAGCTVSPTAVDALLQMANPAGLSPKVNSGLKDFCKEIHARLLAFHGASRPEA
jgi:hypothetical protein